jgi:hypothetical protein
VGAPLTEMAPAPAAPDAPVASERSTSGGPVRNVLTITAVLIFVATAVVGVLFIRRFAVNMIYYDQFTDLNLIRHAHSGHLSFGLLWAQHNENRVFFPNLITLALAYTTHLNIVTEEYLSLAFWAIAVGLIVAAHKRRSPGTSWIYYCPAVLVWMSFTPLSAALFGYRMSWFLALLGLAGALFLLDRPTLSRWVLIGAIAAAVVGSFSALQGLFIWPAGLVLLYLRRRPRTVMAVWVISGVVSGILYFIGYNFKEAGGHGSYVFSHPLLALSFFFSSIGNVVSTDFPRGANAVDYRILILGIIVFAIAIWALIRTFRRDRSDGSPIGAALICFGLLFVFFISLGRTKTGLSQTGSRYSIFEITIWVGAYLALFEPALSRLRELRSEGLMEPDHWRALLRRWTGGAPEPGAPSISRGRAITLVATATLIVLMLIQVVAGNEENLPNTRAWRADTLLDATVMVNIKKAPDALLYSVLGAYPAPFDRSMTAFARSDHLSWFASTSLVAHYAQEGLPPVPAPVTVMTNPNSDTTVTGSRFLLAGATDSYGVKKVQFVLTGGTLHRKVIASGSPQYFGWLGGWNSTTVPNGTYKLQSIAFSPGGKSGLSPTITITVANGPSS